MIYPEELQEHRLVNYWNKDLYELLWLNFWLSVSSVSSIVGRFSARLSKLAKGISGEWPALWMVLAPNALNSG